MSCYRLRPFFVRVLLPVCFFDLVMVFVSPGGLNLMASAIKGFSHPSVSSARRYCAPRLVCSKFSEHVLFSELNECLFPVRDARGIRVSSSR